VSTTPESSTRARQRQGESARESAPRLTRTIDNETTGLQYFFARRPPCRGVDWKRSSAPAQLQECSCGSTAVEEKADGLVTRYRCADCGDSLGDITMGHEP